MLGVSKKSFALAVPAIALAMVFAALPVYAQTVGLGDAVRNAAGEFSAAMEPDTRVAVIAVRSGSAMMSDHLIDEMIMAFVNEQRLLVVNRAQLELIAAELHLGLDGMIDDATAQSIGRLAGVQFIFTGAFEPFGDIYRLRIQAIEVETAIIRRIFTANVRNDAIVSTLLGIAGRRPARRERRERREPRDPDNPRIHWLSGEISGEQRRGFHPGIGIRYERDINELFSVGAAIFYHVVNVIDEGDLPTLMGLLATARFFPVGLPFYFELGVGIGSSEQINFDIHGFILNPALGARLGGNERSFFVNPFISLPVVFRQRGWGHWDSLYRWELWRRRGRGEQPSGSVTVHFRLGVGFGRAW